jgi:hypothetical protein
VDLDKLLETNPNKPQGPLLRAQPVPVVPLLPLPGVRAPMAHLHPGWGIAGAAALGMPGVPYGAMQVPQAWAIGQANAMFAAPRRRPKRKR